MSKYEVSVQVKSVYGSQIFEVEAESESEAIQKVKEGEGAFVFEDIEVQSFDWEDVTVEKSDLF